VVDVISKSGTNRLHGSAFEFLRNSAMDARSFFNTKGTPFPPFRFNQFGFSLGGPVILPKLYDGRNKTFFFVDYEGYRRNIVSSQHECSNTGDAHRRLFGSGCQHLRSTYDNHNRRGDHAHVSQAIASRRIDSIRLP
jgi:hypothetical protein